jgi:hypothetical protein
VAISNEGGLLRFAAVEDVTNSLDIWTFDPNSDNSPDGRHNSSSDDSALGTNLVTTIGMPSDARTGTSTAVMLSQASSNGSASVSRSFLDSSAETLAANMRPTVIDQLFSDTQESDVDSTLFSRHRAGWSQS